MSVYLGIAWFICDIFVLGPIKNITMIDIDKFAQKGVIFKFELTEEQLTRHSTECALKTVEILNSQSKPKQDSAFISGEAVCKILDISRTTLWQLDKKGVTKPIWLRNVKRYRVSDIETIGQNKHQDI